MAIPLEPCVHRSGSWCMECVKALRERMQSEIDALRLCNNNIANAIIQGESKKPAAPIRIHITAEGAETFLKGLQEAQTAMSKTLDEIWEATYGPFKVIHTAAGMPVFVSSAKPLFVDSKPVQFFCDGNQWCCTFQDFKDLQTSPAGFGNTLRLAYQTFVDKFQAKPATPVPKSEMLRVYFFKDTGKFYMQEEMPFIARYWTRDNKDLNPVESARFSIRSKMWMPKPEDPDLGYFRASDLTAVVIDFPGDFGYPVMFKPENWSAWAWGKARCGFCSALPGQPHKEGCRVAMTTGQTHQPV